MYIHVRKKNWVGQIFYFDLLFFSFSVLCIDQSCYITDADADFNLLLISSD